MSAIELYGFGGPPCKECYRAGCDDPLNLLTKTECLQCERCVPNDMFPPVVTVLEDPKYDGCFPELDKSCQERECKTIGDIATGRCAGCERCALSSGEATCGSQLGRTCGGCQDIYNMVQHGYKLENACYGCLPCVKSANEVLKFKGVVEFPEKLGKECRRHFIRDVFEVCEGGPKSTKCRKYPDWKERCLPPIPYTAPTPPYAKLAADAQPAEQQQQQQQPTPVPAPALAATAATPSTVKPAPPCPAGLQSTCRAKGNECLTLGDVLEKGWCKKCGPCALPGAATCADNQRKYCAKNCVTPASKATQVCQSTCAACGL